ncbi:MAG: hypothetical protein PHW18_12900 [Sulfuricurvum sp.]|uniref:hypothetical protein n=1 Tax=Sulfuricurvum sp. TaxID=2025608 RepID=UPI0026079763|nr:hypothetical protein [Sulfuricurvum sp.]MDD2830465.1 hypothetical protein [Sulfuricurvum sp.]MDD4948372.1 hypothetical protein [Sulfuricurvum sp.]
MKKMLKPQALIPVIGLFLLTGCSSHQVKIEQAPPAKYETLGKAEGSASGSLGLLGTAYYFIPMGINSRNERAYENALESVPGATGLMNVTYQENWFWWGIGTARTVTITGDAIKEVK